jgi:hypothetical protein
MGTVTGVDRKVTGLKCRTEGAPSVCELPIIDSDFALVNAHLDTSVRPGISYC